MEHRRPRETERTVPVPGGPPRDDATGADWRDVFYLTSFLNISFSDGEVDRRDRVWIKRFLANRDRPHLDCRMEEILRIGRCDVGELEGLLTRATEELSMGEKRRFIYNLAQLARSRGTLSPAKYEHILDLAERLGMPETEADAMLHSVYRINDTFIAVLGILAFGAIIYWTRSVIIPLVVAIFVTMIINRIDSLLTSMVGLRPGRWFSKVASMVLILGVLFGLSMAAVVSGADIAGRFPEYEARYSLAIAESSFAQSVLSWLDAKGVLVQLNLFPVSEMARSLITMLVTLLSNFVLVVIFTGFLVFSSAGFTGVLAEMNKKVGIYISTKTLVCFITGLTTYLLCLGFGIDFALFWGLLSFLLNFIPVIGSITASLPPVLLSLIQLQSWPAIVIFSLVLVVLNLLIGQVLEPKLMGAMLAIKPVAILLGLIFWGLLWGIPGMFLATPLMVLLRILASYYNFSRSFERLLAADTT
jgi:AI-2 transport protein TqsA